MVEPEEAGSPCEVGPVWSPEASAFDKPIIALAGPMSHHEASDFVKAWKSPTRVDRPSFQAWARSDANRGKIQVPIAPDALPFAAFPFPRQDPGAHRPLTLCPLLSSPSCSVSFRPPLFLLSHFFLFCGVLVSARVRRLRAAAP